MAMVGPAMGPSTDVFSAQVSPAEIKEVVSSFKDTKDVKTIQSNGCHIAGDKFVVLKADDRSVYGKKVRTVSTPVDDSCTEPFYRAEKALSL